MSGVLANNTLIDGNYNLSALLTDEAITDPVRWFAVFNNEVGGIVSVVLLALLGVVLFLNIRNVEGANDARSIAYSGFICSVIGLVLFIARVADDPAGVYKLITWAQLLPFLVITAVGILLDKITTRF